MAFLRRLFKAARRELTLIDPYIDEDVFLMLALPLPAVMVRVFTNGKKAPADAHVLAERLRREGRRVEFYGTADVHDRFFRVDHEWWHSGHSFKDLGNRVSLLRRVTSRETLGKLRRIEEALLAKGSPIWASRKPGS